MTAGPPCLACAAIAASHEHAPFLVDDPGTQFRLWRCPRCAALWAETDRFAQPVSADEASDAFPAWRDHERWIATTSLPLLLQQYRAGLLGDELFARALMHHAVLAPSSDGSADGALALFSSEEAALLDGRDPSTLSWASVARQLRWTSGRRSVVLDPASPWWCELTGYVQEYLDANGRRTVTEPPAPGRGVRDEPAS